MWGSRGVALAVALTGLVFPLGHCGAQDAQVGQVVVSLPAQQGKWFAQGNVKFDNDAIHLASTDLKRASVLSKRAVANDAFTLAFEFRVSSQDTTGQHNGMHVGHRYPVQAKRWHAASYFWDIDLAHPRVLIRSRQDGTVRQQALLDHDLEMDRWYWISLRNAADSLSVELRESPGERGIGRSQIRHDEGPDVPQPIEFWADSELFGLKPKVKPPVIGVFAPYNQYHLTNEWSPYIKVGGAVRDVRLSQDARLLPAGGGQQHILNGGVLSIVSTSGNRLFLRDNGSGKTLLEFPGPRNWPWRLSRLEIDRKFLAFRQTWIGPDPGVVVRVSYVIQPGKPYIRVRTTASNTLPGARQADFAFRPAPPPEGPFNPRAFTFPWTAFDWKRYYDTGEFDFDVDLDQQPVHCVWGVDELSWGAGPGLNLFLPVVALRQEGQRSLVVTWDNRTNLTFRADNSGWSVTRRFYTAAQSGFADSGFDCQDGDGPVPHEIVIGLCDKTDWETLVNDYYLDAYPLYRMDRMSANIHLEPGLEGSQETFFTDSAWTEEKARSMAMEGATTVSLFFGHANLDRYAREFGLNRHGCEFALKFGIIPGLTDNIAVAPQPMKITDPKQCYTRFPDSWVYDEAGNGPFINWEGVTVNQSPRFSFGRFELEHHKDLIKAKGLGRDYIDLYYCWGTDYAHTYRQYGFYPTIVGINEWMREKSAWLRTRGIPYTLNAPHRHSSLVRFGEVVQGDIGDIESFPIFHKIQSGNRLLRTYGGPTEAVYASDNPRYAGKVGAARKAVEFALFAGMARQALPPADTSAEDRQAIVALANRNIALGFAVGQSRLVGGRPFRYYQYLGSNGDAFVAVRNPRAEDAVLPAPFSVRQNIRPEGRYAVFGWDVDSGATLVKRTTGADLLSVPPGVSLGAQQTKVLICLPDTGQATRPYLFWSAQTGLLVCSSSGLISGSVTSGNLAVSATLGRRTVTRLRFAANGAARVAVEGAQDYGVTHSAEDTEVAITHLKSPAVLIISDAKDSRG